MPSHNQIDLVLSTLAKTQGSNTMLGRMSRTTVIGHSSPINSGMTVQKIIRKFSQWFLSMLGMPRALVRPFVMQHEWHSDMGKKYDPFKVLISTILSARAKDETTEIIAEKLFEKYPIAEKLANAKQKDVIEIIRKIGFFNNKSKNIINAAKMLLEKFDGKVPNTLEKLTELPGVGRKVANCVLVYSFGKDAIPVDIHVHRISNRLGWVKTKTPEETEQKLMKIVPQKHWQIVNDTFVSHGKKTCLPISPKCSECPIYNHCKRIGVRYYNK